MFLNTLIFIFFCTNYRKTGFEETCDFLGEINEEFVPVQQADQVEVAQHDIPQMNQEQLEALLSPQVTEV